MDTKEIREASKVMSSPHPYISDSERSIWLTKTLDVALDHIDAHAKEWIKCSDRLPEEPKNILSINDPVYFCYRGNAPVSPVPPKYLYKCLPLHLFEQNNITHWLQLEPPNN